MTDKKQARELYDRGDFEASFAMWLLLAETGDAEAQAWAGSFYANGEGGVLLDGELAFYWYVKAAEQGDHQAQANVGAMCYMGTGVEKNDEQAIKWLSAAAEGGDINGLFNLAVLCTKGEGIEKSDEKAAELYREAAELGHYPSQSRLGYMYAQGQGVSKDRVQAYLWLTLAAQHGIGTALNELESIVKSMSAEEKAQGAQLFDHWRLRTGSNNGPTALYPMPS
ncbi:MAG: tetratricopeptide repeat protein [Pseudomonadales bacterium]